MAVVLHWILGQRPHRIRRDYTVGMGLLTAQDMLLTETVMTVELDFSVVHPDRPGIRKVLGDLEAEIMELIWARPLDQGTTVRDIFEVLYERRLLASTDERRRIAYTTVMNTMTRLAKKQLLRTEKQDQAYIYYPNFSQEEFVSRFVEHMLENLLVNFAGATLNGLSTIADPQVAAKARQLLDKIARRRATEEGT